jgi:transposase
MDTFYLAIAKECFSKSNIVVDHFHVLQLAFRQADEIRNTLQVIHKKKFAVKQIMRKNPYQLKDNEWGKLNECFESFSDMKRVWIILQEVRMIYRQNNRKAGDSQLRKTVWYCKQSNIPEMESLGKTLNRWKEMILNYYISRTTNAYTEGIHTKFELIKRQHCGIRNVERFAKRLMFCMIPFTTITQIFAQSF